MTGLRWYAVGRTIYARRGDEPATNDRPIVRATSVAIAEHIVACHNQTLTSNRLTSAPAAVPAWDRLARR